MCDCNEKKACCDCLRGGCDCDCTCKCHTGDEHDSCYAFPRLRCPECIIAEEAWEQKMDEEETEELRQYNANLPSDAEIRRILG